MRDLGFLLCVCLGTTADDLYPLFAKYGKVVDVFIPRDRRSNFIFFSLIQWKIRFSFFISVVESAPYWLCVF